MPNNFFVFGRSYRNRAHKAQIFKFQLLTRKKYAVDINSHMKGFGDMVKVEIEKQQNKH